ncbi:MAG TPA: hypothetical protein VFQ78_00035 [Candidatus Udaeobacter sp.]|nr:hypothetical protein [Candidatus Udaeobacter sp.]
MPTIADKKFSLPFLSGALLFLCALVFYYFSVLRVDYRRSALFNLKPGPDATEYFAQAVAMSRGERPSIRIGYERLPSAFPPGYSALIVPWLKILPRKDAVLAPFRTNQALGLLLLCVVFGFYLYLSMPVAGGIATVLLATLPGFFAFSRSSLSDVSAWLLYALAFIFAYLGLKEERRWKIYVSAAFLGLSMNLRLQSVFFVPLLIAMPLMPIRQQYGRWFFHCCAAGFVFLVGGSPFLVLNAIEFGSPLKIGGNFWYPARQLFSIRYIPQSNAAMFCQEFALRLHDFKAVDIFGTGTVFVAAFVLLICIGFFFVPFNRAVLCILITNLVFTAGTAAYLYPDGRYYLQLLILLIPVAVLPVIWAIRNLLLPRRFLLSLGILILFIAACLGYPSRGNYKGAKRNRFQAWEAVHYSRYYTWRSSPFWFLPEEKFAMLCGHDPGLVLSDIDPVYLNALLPAQFAAVPVDDNQLRRWSPKWHYDKERAKTMIRQSLLGSIPVYALFISRAEMKAQISRLPAIEGYHWVETHASDHDVILKLLPVS